MSIITGRNAVSEALKAGREIEKIIAIKQGEGSIRQIIAQAKDKKIPIHFMDRKGLDRVAGSTNHQGVVAYVGEFKYSTVDDILEIARKRNEEPFIIILDNLEDPHNLGAIMRTADCTGVHGIIIPKRRSVTVTDTVAKASAGAVEHIKIAKVTNISKTIEELQAQGVWIAACDMGEVMYYEQNLTGSIAVVIGSEGKGISKLVKSKCDFVVSMPMVGHITSLNASNAGAIIMYEILKQRLQANK